MAQEIWRDQQHLIQGLRARDPGSLEALITHYSRELFYFARLILAGAGSVQDVEECLNDLFVTVWQEFDSFDPARGSLRTWLIMRTKYIALDCRRQLLRRQPVELPVMTFYEEYTLVQDERPLDSLRRRQDALHQPMTAGVDVLLEERELREELGRALEQLPEFDRLIVYLRYFHFASIQDLAARTGLTKHAVEARLWRARRALREALQEPARDTPGQGRQATRARSATRIKRGSHEASLMSTLKTQQSLHRPGGRASLTAKGGMSALKKNA